MIAKKLLYNGPYMKYSIKLLVAALLVFLISFTNFYSVSYVIVILFFLKYFYVSKTFESYFARFIVSILTFLSIIMLIGILTWFFKIPLYPPLVILATSSLYLFFKRVRSTDSFTPHIINRGDIVSIASSLVILIVIAVSFYLPKPSTAASFQILTNGYDNTAHFSLLETESDARGYVYGSNADTKKETITSLGAYPQGWHLATSHFMNGFGGDLFQSTRPLTGINMYLLSLFLWFILTIYIVTRTSWRLLSSISSKYQYQWGSYVAFGAATILTQILVYWGSLLLGFASFIGCLVYTGLLAALVIDKNKGNHAISTIMIGLCVVAISQSWLLPFPAVFATLVLSLLISHKYSLSKLLHMKKKININSIALPTAVVMVSILSGIFQVAILQKYNPLGTGGQLNEDGGIFWISMTLLGVLMISTLVGWLSITKTKTSDIKDVKNKFIIILAPLLLLAFAIFVYQLITAGKTSYYFVKTLGLVVCVIGIFFTPIFVKWVNSIYEEIGNLGTALLSVVVIATLIMSTGQNLLSLSNFLQRNSKIPFETAQAIEVYLEQRDVYKDQLIVFRHHTIPEDSDGTYAANRTAHLPDLCANNVITDKDWSMSGTAERINDCANESGEQITVITSNETLASITELHNSKIHIVNIQ